jgi:hypothetical protein
LVEPDLKGANLLGAERTMRDFAVPQIFDPHKDSRIASAIEKIADA